MTQETHNELRANTNLAFASSHARLVIDYCRKGNTRRQYGFAGQRTFLYERHDLLHISQNMPMLNHKILLMNKNICPA